MILAYMSMICPDPIYPFENYLTTEAVCSSETPVTPPSVEVKSGKHGARVTAFPVSAICPPFPQQSLRFLHFPAMWLLHVWGFVAANNRNLQEKPVMRS